MKIISLLLITVLILPLMSCQDDPIDQIAANEIFTDSLYYLDGEAYQFDWEEYVTLDATYTATYIANLSVAEAIPDLSNGPSLNVINGTNYDYRVLSFDDTTAESCIWHFVVPENYPGGSIEAAIFWNSTSATTGATCWKIDFGKVSSGAPVDNAVGGGNAIIQNTDSTAGDLNIGSPFANDPGWGTNDLAIVKLTRYAMVAEDTMIGDANLIAIKLRWSTQTTVRTYPQN